MQAGNKLQVTYYTDPLCCWSWAFEPQWRKFRFLFREHMDVRYCMGGLLPSWSHYVDTQNSVSRPMQMGSLWFQAEKISGMKISYAIWKDDPPSSSFPACIAVKSVSLQSPLAGELYLRRIREACMLTGENISKTSILEELAKDISRWYKDFSFDKFRKDFRGDAGKASFREDWNETKNREIFRFPSLLVKYGNAGNILLPGYRSYESFFEKVIQIAPHLKQVSTNASMEEYQKFWGSLTAREEEEYCMKGTHTIAARWDFLRDNSGQ